MSEPQRVRVGMVGLGLVATSHLKGYLSHPTADVSAVCDVDLARAEEFAATHGIPHVFCSYHEMLAAADIDAVDIATPTHLHSEMAVHAARAGKHIHCEKPFCRSVAEGMAAYEAASTAGVRLLVGETYVFLSSHVKARELIDAGEIGRPQQVRQRHGVWLERPKARVYTGPPDRNWRVDPVKSGGGDYPWIFDHAVHFFATAEYLALGCAVSEVYAVAASGGSSSGQRGAAHDPYRSSRRDIPIISWLHEGGACQGVWTRAERLNGKYDYMRGFSTIVSGETGMIEVLGEGGHNLLWDSRQQHLVLHRAGKEPICLRFDEGGDDVWQSDISYYSEGHINQVHHFVDSITGDSDPRYGALDGVRAVRCTLATIRSAQEHRPVRIDEVGLEYTAYGDGE